MNDFDMDTALADLINAERKKEKPVPGFEYLVVEREAVTQAFNDHVVAFHSMQDNFTPEGVFRVLSDEEVNEMYGVLDGWIAKDIAQHEVLSTGMMRVSGEGVYTTHASDEEDASGHGFKVAEVLGGDDILIGEIAYYEVMPISREEDLEKLSEGRLEELSSEDGVPAVWVVLKDVSLYEADGREVESFAKVAVPFSLHTTDPFDGFEFHKAIDSDEEEPELHLDDNALVEKIFGSLFMAHCTSIERELNKSNYAGEQLAEYLESYVKELHYHIKNIPMNQKFLISANNGFDLATSNQVDLNDRLVTYYYPSIVRIADKWRIVHCFLDASTQSDEIAILQVRPSNIFDVRNPIDT